METTVQIRLTEEYYKKALQEIITYHTRFRKHQMLFTVLMFLIIIFVIAMACLEILPQIFIYIGVFLTFMCTASVHDYFDFRRKWLADRMNSQLLEKTVSLTFTNENILHEGPFTKGEMLWTGFANATKTLDGLLLVPQNGISIYVPKSSFANEKLFEEVWDKLIDVLQNRSR